MFCLTNYSNKRFKCLKSQALRRLPPSLALLGPPGSGKSIFLNQLVNSFNLENGALGNTRCLTLDLRTVPIGSQFEIYFHINQALLQEAARIGIDKDFDIKVQIPHLRFEEILRELLAAVEGNLVMFIDHLESVPRLFASDLSHRFRNFLETTEHDSEYLRLGLVVAGVVSLYDLKHGPNSAFQMLPVIRFPQTETSTRVQLVEDYLKNSMSLQISRNLLNLFADLTGGEPGFLEPLIRHLLREGKQISLTEELIAASVQDICSQSQIPALRNLALHLWGDGALREIVRDLAQRPSVMQRSVAPDIDRYELSGAVVVAQGSYGKTREYKFSNDISKRYLTDLYNVLETNCPASRPEFLIDKELRNLETKKLQCLNATRIWSWLNAVGDAWVAITPYYQPKLHLYFTQAGGDSGWWLDADVGKISDPELRGVPNTSTEAATFTALEQLSLAFSGDTDSVKAFIESDPEQISIAIPLYAREIAVVIAATLSRTDAGRGLTEFDLCHWLRFLQNVKQVAPTLVLAEIGQATLQEREREKSETPKRVDRIRTKTIFLLPDGDAVVEEPGCVNYISGKIPNIDHMNKSCLELVDQWTDHRRFEEGVQGIASQLDIALEAKFRDLADALAPEPGTGQTVIASNAEGLRIPFELFPHANSHLALLTAVSRQITGHQLRADVCVSFDRLLTSLAKKRGNLRVLLIASYKDPELSTSEELKRVRQHIAAGCKRLNLRPEFVELLPAEATVANVDKALMENGPYHIVHYSGHGRHFSEDPEASGVVLLGNDGEVEVVKCKTLRGWFTEAKSWLVYLSCCNSSASSGTRLGLSARYLGMMDAVVAAGVPNVIGFRCLVSDQSALHLADEFYRQVFTLQPERNLNLALLTARQKVNNASEFFDAWASSMLITQYS
ncbi:MAG TPA: CHAT domain-containing protein [Pyrinomonadaceae bacterium]|nr:CHAT domain-containing protein [Pyrinomonadaceae bacterium]